MAVPRKLGLALSGGGARGIAHIGFLQVLEQEGIEVSAVSGTSMGAIVGGGFAIYRESRILEDLYHKFLKTDLFHRASFDFLNQAQKKHENDQGWLDWLGGKMRRIIFQGIMLTRSGLLSDEVYKRIIDFFIPEVTFDQTGIPLACAALNLTEGRTVIFREGRVRPAVQASAALPGLTEPLHYQGRLYSDGGGVMVVPVEPLKDMGAQVIVAVDVDKPVKPQESFGNVLEVVIRWAEAGSARLKEKDLAQADLVIRPEVEKGHWSDFQAAEEFMEAGRRAARENLEAIQRLMEPRLWWNLGRFFQTQQQ